MFHMKWKTHIRSQTNSKSDLRRDLLPVLILCFGDSQGGQHRRKYNPDARICYMSPRTDSKVRESIEDIGESLQHVSQSLTVVRSQTY